MEDRDLSVFFRPQGVAVIGASHEPQKLGYGVVRNLQSVRYEGPVYPVNKREEYILGYKVYRSVEDVPDPVDLAVIVVPARAVAEQMEACGRRGIRGAIIISGGFRETGREGQQLEDEIRAIAKRRGIRVVGPNCIGTIDSHTPLNTTFVVGMPRPGDIGFVSQSGAMAAAAMDWALGSGVGFSRIVSLGNQVDVTSAEMLEPVAGGGRTRVITGYIEGVEDGEAFVEAACKVATELPVVILKGGQGKSGAKAIASHTGALAGEIAAYRAAFRRAGVLWAGTMEELFDAGRALAWQPLPAGNRVAILTNGGGPAILAADALEEAGMCLAPLTSETKAFLRRRVLGAASVENPVDILAGSGPATYAVCLDALLTDETVDAVVVIQAPQDWFKPASLAEVVGEVANSPLGQKKPVLTVIMGVGTGSEATQILHSRRVPNYEFPERVGKTLGAMWQRRRWLDRLQSWSAPVRPSGVDVSGARAVLVRAKGDAQEVAEHGGPKWLNPEATQSLLRCYGIGLPGSKVVTSAEGAVDAGRQLKYPVALKLVADGVSHKTEVGGVVLNVRSDEEMLREYSLLMGRTTEGNRHMNFRGVEVQPMVKGVGELIVGVVRDPQFGPLVMAGLGGTLVEVRREVEFELAPLTAEQALGMLDRTAAARLLAGFRGAPRGDREAVAETIVRLATLASDLPEVQEIEINPLIALEDGKGAVAVDARVRVG